mmetsp:Transcript_113626/g.332021  ORF Transcript_113626/g.332021 Transcript_113626/m.332021 type:complete len:458 (-) Transcript_113626:32-1405(-)
MDFDDLDDAEANDAAETGSQDEPASGIDLARQAGFVPARELPCIDGLYCFSDANCDEKASQTFIRRLTLPGAKKQELGSLNRISQSALIVAGGLARSPNDLHTAFEVMRTRVANIHFVPGSLELHIKSDADFNDLPPDERKYHDSLDKAKYLLSRFCKHVGVTAAPQAYDCGGEALWVVPLLSYSAPSFDAEPDLCDAPGGAGRVQDSRDLSETVWPKGLDPMTDEVANAMDSLNEWLLLQMPEGDRLALEKALRATPQERAAAATRIVSFSHFVPLLDLVPEKRFLPNPNMAKMAGSDALRRRVTAMKPDLHVFGHSCFGWDAVISGTRFVQAPLATLDQRLVGDTAIGNFPNFESGEPLMLRQGQAWAEPYVAGWSEYYKKYPREAHEARAMDSRVRRLHTPKGERQEPIGDCANTRPMGRDLAPKWVHHSIQTEAEGYRFAEGGAHSGFTYGRV